MACHLVCWLALACCQSFSHGFHFFWSLNQIISSRWMIVQVPYFQVSAGGGGLDSVGIKLRCMCVCVGGCSNLWQEVLLLEWRYWWWCTQDLLLLSGKLTWLKCHVWLKSVLLHFVYLARLSSEHVTSPDKESTSFFKMWFLDADYVDLIFFGWTFEVLVSFDEYLQRSIVWPLGLLLEWWLRCDQ